MSDRIAEIWGKSTPFAADEEWPVRVDQYLLQGLHDDNVE